MTRYPLAWPPGWKRTEPASRTRALFLKHAWGMGSPGTSETKPRKIELSVYDGTSRVLLELSRLKVQEGDVVISTNMPVRLDGLPRSDRGAPADPGVAVYWQIGERRQVMAIDRYDRVADNLAAVAATLEAMRAIERHGGAQILERAFQGFDALPAPKDVRGRGWQQVLELDTAAAVITLDAARAAYRRLSTSRHPDRPGGSHDAMSELNWAWAQAQEALKSMVAA